MHDELQNSESSADPDDVCGDQVVGLEDDVLVGYIEMNNGRGAVDCELASLCCGLDGLETMEVAIGDVSTAESSKLVPLGDGR